VTSPARCKHLIDSDSTWVKISTLPLKKCHKRSLFTKLRCFLLVTKHIFLLLTDLPVNALYLFKIISQCKIFFFNSLPPKNDNVTFQFSLIMGVKWVWCLKTFQNIKYHSSKIIHILNIKIYFLFFSFVFY
jgi:predicted ferric reductase